MLPSGSGSQGSLGSEASLEGRDPTSLFLALLAQGAQVRWHRGQPLAGPPVLAVLSLDISSEDEAEHALVLQPRGRCAEAGRWQPSPLRCLLKDVRHVVPGCETTTFKRTAKYAAPEQQLDRYLNSFSLVVASSGSPHGSVTIDLEVPQSEGGNLRRQRLVEGFVEVCGAPALDVPPPPWHYEPTDVLHRASRVMSSTATTAFVYACIMASVVVMACSTPLFEHDAALAARFDSEMRILAAAEAFLTWVFTVEVVARIVALESVLFYLGDPWNALDAFVVASGWISELSSAMGGSGSEGGMNFTALRALRALRVLRTFKVLPGIREIVDTFVKTLAVVTQGMFIYFYFLTLFTVCALEAFGEDTLSHSCVNTAFNVTVKPTIYCTTGAQGALCPAGTECRRMVKPLERGLGSFATALTTLYTVSVRAGLGQLLRGLASTVSGTGQRLLVVLFFLFFNLFVTGMVFSIFIAIIRSSFAATRRQAAARHKRVEEKKRLLPERRRSKRKVAPEPGPAGHGDIKGGEAVAAERGGRALAYHPFGPFGRAMAWLVAQRSFDSLTNAAILVNSVFFGLAFFGQDASWAAMLATSEAIFAYLFLLEALSKLVGLGSVRAYFSNAWNCFDFFIVASSFADLYMPGGVSLSFFRILRLLRIVRLLRRSPDVVKIVNALIASVPALGNLILFCVLLLTVFAVLGMQLYGAQMGLPPAERLQRENITFAEAYAPPRSNFDTFPNAMLALFQMMSGGAQWPIYFAVLDTPQASTAPVFFLIFGVFSSFIILNFMVVIIMSNFAMKEDDLKLMRRDREKRILAALTKKRDREGRQKGLDDGDVIDSIQALAEKVSRVCEGEGEGSAALDATRRHPRSFQQLLDRVVGRQRQEYALLILPPTSPVRRAMRSFAMHPIFEGLVIVAILASSALLTFESPAHADDAMLLRATATASDAFLGIFAAEFAAKVLAFGFVLPSSAYLRDPWNRLDLAVLILSVAGKLGMGGEIGRMLRLGRVVRPLRMINRNEGLKVIVDALGRAARPVSYLAVLLMAYFYAFGIMGMEFFLGKFWRCNDASVDTREQCAGHFVDPALGYLIPRVWSNPPFHFDSIGEALGTLVETIALKGWPEKLWVAMDTVGVGLQPKRFAAPFYSVYFVLFVYFGSFFMMKLFVGIIVGTFRSFSGNLLLTPGQLQWIEMKRVMAQMQPRVLAPAHWFRRRCYQLRQNPSFEAGPVVLVIVHLVALVFAQTKVISADTGLALHVLLSMAKIAMHSVGLLALGPTRLYFRLAYSPQTLRAFWTPQWSKVFEALALAMHVVFPLAGLSHELAAILPALDFTRMLRLVGKGSPKLKQIIVVLSECILAMCNVTLVFFMFLFIWALLGMQLFASVKHGQMLGSTASFYTFPEALLTVFQISAGDNWITLMRDCSVEPPHCQAGVDCGSAAMARVYFFSFYVLCFGVFVNLYVATIIDAYESKSKVTTFKGAFTSAQFERFQKTWESLDTHSTGRISVKLFRKMFYGLGVPFATAPRPWTEREKSHQYNQARFEIFPLITTGKECGLQGGKKATAEDDEPSIGFFEVLEVVVQINVDIEALTVEERVKRFRKKRFVTNNLAAMTIQAFYRGWQYKRMFKAMLHAENEAQQEGTTLRSLAPDAVKQRVSVAYTHLTGRPLAHNSMVLFSLHARDEISFDNVKQAQAAGEEDAEAEADGDDFDQGARDMSLLRIVEEDNVDRHVAAFEQSGDVGRVRAIAHQQTLHKAAAGGLASQATGLRGLTRHQLATKGRGALLRDQSRRIAH